MQMKHNSQRQHFCLPFNVIFCSILVNQLSSLAYSLINFRQSSLIGSIVDFLAIITIFFFVSHNSYLFKKNARILFLYFIHLRTPVYLPIN